MREQKVSGKPKKRSTASSGRKKYGFARYCKGLKNNNYSFARI